MNMKMLHKNFVCFAFFLIFFFLKQTNYKNIKQSYTAKLELIKTETTTKSYTLKRSKKLGYLIETPIS